MGRSGNGDQSACAPRFRVLLGLRWGDARRCVALERTVATFGAMGPADAERIRAVRKKAASYPALARAALRRGDKKVAGEYWRLWHEAFEELFNHLADK
jgi:hypothetical protein